MKRGRCAWPSTEDLPLASNLGQRCRGKKEELHTNVVRLLPRHPSKYKCMFQKSKHNATTSTLLHFNSEVVKRFFFNLLIVLPSLVRCKHVECYERAAQKLWRNTRHVSLREVPRR